MQALGIPGRCVACCSSYNSQLKWEPNSQDLRSMPSDNPHTFRVVIPLFYSKTAMQEIPHVPLVSSLQVLNEVLRQVAEFPPCLASNVLHLVEVLASLHMHL